MNSVTPCTIRRCWPDPMRRSIGYVSLGLRLAPAVELPTSLVGIAEPAIAEPQVLVPEDG